MTVAEIMKKMIAYADGSLHDINHLMKVYTYARTIGACEGLDADTQKTLEIAAIVHDIACPDLRKRYGSANGKKQEEEGCLLAREFLKDTRLSEGMVERVAYLVGHHHTITGVDGPDYQILLEADYLVNADESGYSRENIVYVLENMYKTKTGKELLKEVYEV